MKTDAQINRTEECRIVIEDALAILPVSEWPSVIARAMLKVQTPDVVASNADIIGQMAHHARRGDMPMKFRWSEDQHV